MLLTFSVLDDLGGGSFHDRDAGVRRAQIDADNATKGSVVVQYGDRFESRKDLKSEHVTASERLRVGKGQDNGYLRREGAALVEECSNSVLFFQKGAQHFTGLVLLRVIKLINTATRRF
jgi:hypothetical protein